MQIFLTLLAQIIPLYVMIMLGYAAGRFLQVDVRNISLLVIYTLVPLVVFSSVLRAPVTPAIVALPFLVALLCCALCLATYRVLKIARKRRWLALRQSEPNILAFMAGNSNTGYFGIPIVATLFDASMLGIYVTAMLGTILYENTLGFYVAAKGAYSGRECLRKLLRLPALYGFAAALALNLAHVSVPPQAEAFFVTARGAYTMLGMMIIGLGLAAVKFDFQPRFALTGLAGKFVIWPLAAGLLVYLDRNFLGLYDDERVHTAIVLISFMPVAANSVAFASMLKTHPQEAATTVILSTLFALVYLPVMIGLFIL